MAKRYQQIIDKEFKLLSKFPVYYDGQMIPLTTPVKATMNTPLSFKAGGKQTGASTCKSSGKCTETGSISANEYRSSSILTEKTEDNKLPKIVEVYSLNSLKSNTQEHGLMSNTQDGPSFKNEETFVRKSDMSTKLPSKGLLQDANTCTLSKQIKPCLVSDNFIDLTIDDEEETRPSNEDDIARPSDEGRGRDVNADDQSEFDRPREDRGDRGLQRKRSNQGKRKGVFGSRKKGKRICPAQNQKQKNTNKSLNAGWDNVIQGDQDKTQDRVLNDQQYSHQGNGEQKLGDLHNDNDCRKEEKSTEERKEHWNGNRINGGLHSSSDMTYRESKITNLKARLAKQEQELARLRTQKESKVRSMEAQDQDAGQEEIESKTNDWSTKVHERQEATKDVPVEVNLDEICQHVIKSFDIFNARQRESKTRKKEGCHTVNEENTGIKKQAERKSDINDVAYLPQRRQDEFLSQIGLRRRPSNS